MVMSLKEFILVASRGTSLLSILLHDDENFVSLFSTVHSTLASSMSYETLTSKQERG